jgi:hypothetical protein
MRLSDPRQRDGELSLFPEIDIQINYDPLQSRSLALMNRTCMN